jgi:uncharacterized protein YlzI (FlbEa/FlbD family)
MKNFIKVTDKNTNEEIYINVQRIRTIIPSEPYTFIWLSDKCYSIVKESVDEIEKLIEEATE